MMRPYKKREIDQMAAEQATFEIEEAHSRMQDNSHYQDGSFANLNATNYSTVSSRRANMDQNHYEDHDKREKLRQRSRRAQRTK